VAGGEHLAHVDGVEAVLQADERLCT